MTILSVDEVREIARAVYASEINDYGESVLFHVGKRVEYLARCGNSHGTIFIRQSVGDWDCKISDEWVIYLSTPTRDSFIEVMGNVFEYLVKLGYRVQHETSCDKNRRVTVIRW
jgi:hypothetical protein